MIEPAIIKQTLEQYANIELALLFGSAAKNKLTPNSDIDIGISTNTPLTAPLKLEIIQQLADKLGRPIDLIDLKTASPLLTEQILKNNQRLIGSNSAYGTFISRHLMDYEDFAPLQKRILKTRREKWIKQS